MFGPGEIASRLKTYCGNQQKLIIARSSSISQSCDRASRPPAFDVVQSSSFTKLIIRLAMRAWNRLISAERTRYGPERRILVRFGMARSSPNSSAASVDEKCLGLKMAGTNPHYPLICNPCNDENAFNLLPCLAFPPSSPVIVGPVPWISASLGLLANRGTFQILARRALGALRCRHDTVMRLRLVFTGISGSPSPFMPDF